MTLFILVLFLLPQLSFGALYLENVRIETNRSLMTFDIKHDHNDKSMAIMNISAQTFVTITKAMMYLKVNIVTKKDGRAFTQELVRTRIDFVKLLQGLYGNFLVKNFMDNIISDITALNLTMPLPAKTFKLYNFAIKNTEWIPLANNTQGNIDIRFVASALGSKSSQFFCQIVSFGSFLKT